jgi:hypothetical protein
MVLSKDFAPAKGREGGNAVNYHHHFHPEVSEELGWNEETRKKLPADTMPRIQGLAVRYSRGQLVPSWLHVRYHKIFEGPELPQTQQEKFTTVVLACAGVVPREAIDLHDPKNANKRQLSDKEHDWIRRRLYYEGAAERPKYPDRKGEIGRFIATYAIEHSLDEILTEEEVKRKVDEFLIPKSDSSRQEAGRFLLAQVVDASVAELIPLHERAKKKQMTKRTTKKLGDIMLKYFTASRFPDYFAPLEDRLNIVV